MYIVCKKTAHNVVAGVYESLSEARKICCKKNKGNYYQGAYGVFEAVGTYFIKKRS